jgi:hypothetical protein
MGQRIKVEFLKLCKNEGIENEEFINSIVFNPFLTAIKNKFWIDIIRTEENFAKLDNDYDPINCTYKGKECSFGGFVKEKYGQKYYDFMVNLVGGVYSINLFKS